MRVGRLRSIRKCSSNANHQCHDRDTAHRGPNGLGTQHEVVGQAHVSLGHSRLAIQDLSDAGSQPMHVGHHWIVFNGEVYNFKDLRSELEQLGRQFRSDTDTEVVVQAFDEWGPGCVDRFIGMFAFVIIDEKTRHLHAFVTGQA